MNILRPLAGYAIAKVVTIFMEEVFPHYVLYQRSADLRKKVREIYERYIYQEVREFINAMYWNHLPLAIGLFLMDPIPQNFWNLREGVPYKIHILLIPFEIHALRRTYTVFLRTVGQDTSGCLSAICKELSQLTATRWTIWEREQYPLLKEEDDWGKERDMFRMDRILGRQEQELTTRAIASRQHNVDRPASSSINRVSSASFR